VNLQIPNQDFTNIQSIRVTNHKKKSTVQDTYNSESDSDQSLEELKKELTVVQMSTENGVSARDRNHFIHTGNSTLMATLRQNVHEITENERIGILRKIFLKW